MNKDESVSRLKQLSHKDNFGARVPLYSGVRDQKIKDSLAEKFNLVINSFEQLIINDGSKKEILELLKLSIFSFDRNNIDTEDAENIGVLFEEIMDCVDLESSDGAINYWMYGFDIENVIADKT